MGVYRIDPPVRLKPPSLVAVTFVATPPVVFQGLGPQRTQPAAYRRDNELRPYQQRSSQWIITGGVDTIAVSPPTVVAAYLRTPTFPYLPGAKSDTRTTVVADVFALPLQVGAAYIRTPVLPSLPMARVDSSQVAVADVFAPPQQWAAAYLRPQSFAYYQEYRTDASFNIPPVPYKAPLTIAPYRRDELRLDFPQNQIALNYYGPLTADPTSYAVTGIDATLAWGGVQTADVTTFVLNGVNADLLYSAAPPPPDVVTQPAAGGQGSGRKYRRVLVGNKAYLVKTKEDLDYLLAIVLSGDPPKKKSKVVTAPETWVAKPVVPAIAAKVIQQTDDREVLIAIQKRLDDEDEDDIEALLLL